MADLYIVATLASKEGCADALRDAMSQAVEAFRHEDGCLGYTLLEDRKRAGRFVTYERWRDEAALKAHMSSPTMRALAPTLPELLDGGLSQDFLDAILVL